MLLSGFGCSMLSSSGISIFWEHNKIVFLFSLAGREAKFQVLGKAIEFAFGVSYTLGALQSSGSERRTKIELY